MLARKELIDHLNDLFVTTRFKYIKQEKDGTYRTFDAKKNQRHYNFNDVCLERHLNMEETYGIFSASNASKFVCFDIDTNDPLEAKRAVYVLHQVFTDLSIPTKYVYTSLSGSKGYHVEIFFEELISISILQAFFTLVIISFENLLDPNHPFRGIIEFRPTFGQGLKLPLGLHQKANVICWYVNVQNGCVPIASYDILSTIRKIPYHYIEQALEQVDRKLPISPHNKTSLHSHDSSSGSFKEKYSNLLESGLTQPSTRFITLTKLAKLHYLNGVQPDKCKVLLEEWLHNQPKGLYVSDWATCSKDITRIIEWTYDQERKVYKRATEIELFESEIKEIMNNKRLRIGAKKVLFAMLVHSKRFPSPDGVFYLTFSQLEEMVELSHHAVYKNVDQLNNQQIVIPVLTGQKESINGKIYGKPNHYKINIAPPTGRSWSTEINQLSQYVVTFYLAIYHLYDLSDLRKKIPAIQYKNIKETIAKSIS